MSEVVRRRLIISGRVQGVFFRDGVRQAALAAGVSGWARNLSDGRVEVVLEGGSAAVDQVVGWCQTGSSRALVVDIKILPEPVVGESGFFVR